MNSFNNSGIVWNFSKFVTIDLIMRDSSSTLVKMKLCGIFLRLTKSPILSAPIPESIDTDGILFSIYSSG